ncbi:MAG: Gfo/Idh/MocA family oxidoreductase [Candidatus Poribacteria bacterium]|nr:Gfo/Idh/MocA family oxidoreductase [Candidatus Poribacteria bacterium]
MKTYRVNILGCRGRGTAAARAYHAHPRTEIVGLCDLIDERLNTLGDEVGVSARFTDLDEMIRQTEPDIVAIPTGTEFHYDLCMRVLEHGVHIEVEKPMCVDLVQADDVIAKAQEKGARVAVHHQGRVGAAMQAIGQAFTAGKIGELRYIYGSGKGYYGGYGLMNIGAHMLNNMLKFGGHCRSVVAQATTDGHPITPGDVVPSPSGMGTIACEHITAALQFEHGVTGTLLQHRFDRMDSAGYAMELYGSEGRLVWKSGSAWWLPQPHFIPDGTHDRWEVLEAIYPEHYDPQGAASEADYWFVEEYVRALDGGRAHECSGVEGRHVVEIMMGIFESAAYRTRVDLPQKNREHPLLRWRSEAGLGRPAEMPRPYGEWLSAEFKRLGR